MDQPREVQWGGFTWYRYPESKRRSDRVYYKRTSTGKPVWLHRAVYEHHNGPIPRGHHVHHVDGDPFNNLPWNLQVITGRDHVKQHLAEHAKSSPRWWERGLILARDAARAWHASPAGLTWHSSNGTASWAGRAAVKHACTQCGVEFESRAKVSSTCSMACHAARRRASGKDDELRICAFCGEKFATNRFKPKKFCTRVCYVRSRSA